MAYFLSPALAQLRAEVNATWPHRDKTSDGWIGDTSHQARPSDHNPDYSAGGIVRALDIDEDLVAGLTAVGEAMPLVNQIIRDPRTRYVIYEGRIWYVDTQRWQPYSGPNAHRHHIHVSVRKTGNYDRDASPWGIARATNNPTTGGGPVTIPNIPGAPAPIEEDDMNADQDRALAEIWRNQARLMQVIEALDVRTGSTKGNLAVAAKQVADIHGRVNFANRPDGTPYKIAVQGDVETILAAIAGVKTGGPVDVKALAELLAQNLGDEFLDDLISQLTITRKES